MGLGWLGALRLSRLDRQLASYAPMDEWLVEVKPEADARGTGNGWLNLVEPSGARRQQDYRRIEGEVTNAARASDTSDPAQRAAELHCTVG